MPLRGPLPITDRKRKFQFQPEPTARVKRIPRAELIDYLDKTKRGINPKIERMLRKGIARIETRGKTKGLRERQIRISQALYLDLLAAKYTDHLISRIVKMGALKAVVEEENKSLSENQKIIYLENNPNLEAQRKLWEHIFGKTIARQVTENKFENARGVIRHLSYANRYLKVPNVVHQERTLAGPKINRIVNKLIASRTNVETNIEKEVRGILKKRVNPPGAQIKNPAALQARDIVVAASIYADVMKETKGKWLKLDEEELKRFWRHAYSEAMEKIYPLIEKEDKLLEEIIRFHGKRPLVPIDQVKGKAVQLTLPLGP